MVTLDTLQEYHDNGFLILKNYGNLDSFIDDAILELHKLVNEKNVGIVREKDGETVRALHGSHLYSDFFAKLICYQPILSLAEQILNSSVYLHQFKINVKQPLTGDAWPWHQDFPYWHYRDGIPEAKFVNIAIYLDDVTECNGPLQLIPGSHKAGILPMLKRNKYNTQKEGWMQDVSSDLTYQIDPQVIHTLTAKTPAVTAVGGRATVLVFHSQIAHASSSNNSKSHRRVLFLTYNNVCNLPNKFDTSTPEYLVSHDYSPLKMCIL